MKHLLLWILFSIAISSTTAQQQRSASGEPIDFMTIVIEGSATLHLPKSLVKESPELPTPYRRTELDSINPLEKVPLFRSDPPEYPRRIIEPTEKATALLASAGLYGFASLTAIHRTQLDQYAFDVKGVVDRGGAYLPNADYLRTQVRIAARTAVSDPTDNFSVVSSGDLTFDTRSYRLFALPNAPGRSSRLFSLSFDRSDRHNELPYRTHVLIGNAHLRHADTLATDETELRAQLQGRFAQFGNVIMSADVDASIRNYRTRALHFHTAAAYGRYADNEIALDAQLGAQIATTSLQTVEFSPIVDIRAEWQTTPMFRLTANLGSRMAPVRFTELLVTCPYIADTAILSVNRIAYQIGIGGTFTLTPHFRAAIELGAVSYSAGVFMESLSDGTFNPEYAAQIERLLRFRGWFTIDHANYLAADLNVTDVRFGNGNRVPYRPLLTAAIEYGRTFNDRLLVTARVGYMSARRISSTLDGEVASYFVLAGSAEYRISDTFGVTATLDNLTSSTIELWRGYRERGSFLSIGAVVRF